MILNSLMSLPFPSPWILASLSYLPVVEVTFRGFWGYAVKILAASAQASWNTCSWEPWGSMEEIQLPWGHDAVWMPGQHPDIRVIPAMVLDFLEQSRAECWAVSKFMIQEKHEIIVIMLE